MGNNPKISVIIVSYNFERYLSQCIESVYNQSLKPCEILICDDASTDGSWNIIESYRARYPDLIRTIRQITNTGPYQNWKSAYQMVRGELLSVIDGDDYWHPDKLLREWQALQNNPRARAAWSSVILYHEENGRSEEWIPEENVTETNDLFVQVYAKRFFKGKRSLFRNELVYKDAFDNVGFNASIPVHLDWDMKIRLTFRYPVVWSGARTVYYRLHDSGIHKTRHDKMYASARQVAMKNMALLRNRPKTDTDYVLDNVNALLRQLSGQGGHKHEDLTQRDVFPGPLLVNSLPKAGTNLLTKALRMMPGITETSLHFGNSTQNTSGQKGATLPIGVDMPKPYSLEAFRRQLNALPEHSFLSAHIPYTETAARVLREQGIPILLMLRDPADVALSHATYVTKTPEHPLHAYYQTLSEDARILFSITGGRANDVTLLSLEERLQSIVRWMDEPNVTVIRFEELVGARGGGDDAAQRETLKKIARTIGVDADDSVLNDIQHQLFGGTGTFNKGVRGAARQRFTREHR
ncbi:MAG: glycosyltransferase, partial [Calditrichaeota bacterium]